MKYEAMSWGDSLAWLGTLDLLFGMMGYKPDHLFQLLSYVCTCFSFFFGGGLRGICYLGKK